MDSEYNNWSILRRNKNIMFLYMSSYIINILIEGKIYSEHPILFEALNILWVLGLFFFVFKYAMTKCPNCRKPLKLRDFYGNIFSRYCLHCNIKIGARSVSKK